jgi:hypothetical protein
MEQDSLTAAETSRSAQTSSAFQPSTSRSAITCACIGGSGSIVDSINARVSFERSWLRGSRSNCSGAMPNAPACASGRPAGSVPGRGTALRRRPRRPRARRTESSSFRGGVRLGPVHEDAEDPSLEKRAALEALEPLDEAEPRLLDDLLCDRAILDVGHRHAQQRAVVARDDVQRASWCQCPCSRLMPVERGCEALRHPSSNRDPVIGGLVDARREGDSQGGRVFTRPAISPW